jgi:hypothetical protein
VPGLCDIGAVRPFDGGEQPAVVGSVGSLGLLRPHSGTARSPLTHPLAELMGSRNGGFLGLDGHRLRLADVADVVRPELFGVDCELFFRGRDAVKVGKKYGPSVSSRVSNRACSARTMS